MMTRSMMMSSNPSPIVDDKKKKTNKSDTHKPPIFNCGCFDCYTSYWYKWDSSPNHELIHQAIKEHLANDKKSKKNTKGKKREKMDRNTAKKPAYVYDTPVSEIENTSFVGSAENDSSPMVLTEKAEKTTGKAEEEEEALPPMVLQSSPASNHKGNGYGKESIAGYIGVINFAFVEFWNLNV